MGSSGVFTLVQEVTEALLLPTFTKGVECKMLLACTPFSHFCTTHFYCLRHVHVADNLPRATHTQKRVKTT